ncbi:MAG: class I SAM-dependent methyltransferase [Candidatus Aenigmarchaeota archaeon]|nr:class I SAM-dependent methyltransferase [Candidatus Aenigmarchaeota archaeon]
MNMDITQQMYNGIAEKYTKNWKKLNVTGQFRKKFIRYVKKGKIADIGCGPGISTNYFSKKFHVVGIDSSEEMIKIAKKRFRLEFILADMRKMRFEENSLNGAWVSQSLHHIPKKECIMVLRKIKKYLKNDGVLFISVREGSFEGFTDKSKNEIFSGRKRFVAMYTEDELNEILSSLNYKVIEVSKVRRSLDIEPYINVFARNIK